MNEMEEEDRMLNWMRRRLRKNDGFTLIELLAVVAIIGVLAALALPRVFQVINNSKSKSARADLATVSSALEQYYNDYNSYPTILSDLIDKGYLKSTTTLVNPFGKRYFYAINQASAPTAYVLGDPGQNPTAKDIYKCAWDGCPDWTQQQGLPQRFFPEGPAVLVAAQTFDKYNWWDNHLSGSSPAAIATAPTDGVAVFRDTANCKPNGGACRADVATQ